MYVIFENTDRQVVTIDLKFVMCVIGNQLITLADAWTVSVSPNDIVRVRNAWMIQHNSWEILPPCEAQVDGA